MVFIQSDINNSFFSYQEKVYAGLNESAVDHPYKARLNAVGVTLIDSLASGPLQGLVQTVACSAYAVLNLFGALFSASYTLKHSLKSAQAAVSSAITLPVNVFFLPFNFIFQLGAALYDPANVRPLCNLETFK